MNVKKIEKEKLQWIKGEKIGQIEEIKKSDDNWIYFNSGNRISSNLLNEFLANVDESPLIYKEDFNYNKKTNNTEKTIDNKKSNVKISPIMNLLTKVKDTENHKLNINIPINIPNKEIYNILKKSFGKDEVCYNINKFIKNQINNKKINSLINESIDDIIKNI